jgi:hypothetical protein
VGLNLLLLLAFVFRRAINGILVNLYSVWRTRTEEQRHVLRELYEKMDVLNHDYLFMLVTSGMIHSAQTDAQRQILLDQQHAISPRLGATRTFLADHELEFPREVRQLVEKLRMELVLPSVQAADDVSAILRHSEVLTRVTRAIKTAVSECMRGSPWLRMRMIRRRDGHASKV